MASKASHAFAGCSGLNAILNELEVVEAPTQKPLAAKARFYKRPAAKAKAPAAKAKSPVAKAKAPAFAKAKAPAVDTTLGGRILSPGNAARRNKLRLKAAEAKASAVAKAKAQAPAVAKANAPAVALSDTRKCVHSRAYKFAELSSKRAGLSPSRSSAAAREAGREAARQWDMTH